MLKMKGHQVAGISLDPDKTSHFNQSNISRFVDSDYRLDIRDKTKIRTAFREYQPEVIIHLAAQPLVFESYRDPVGTYETNVIGTLNILEASKELDDLKTTLVITTDKVYKNKNQLKGYFETDELGGYDPYSSSKAAADIATQSWRACFSKSPLGIARAGNVIGGGDWSKNRIFPDIIKSITREETLKLRNPNAIRPWQHILDCLNCYLQIIDHQIKSNSNSEWNVGPTEDEYRRVENLVQVAYEKWGAKTNITYEESSFNETMYLLLDSSRARIALSWKEKLDFEASVEWTVNWYKSHNKIEATEKQIEKFLELGF